MNNHYTEARTHLNLAPSESNAGWGTARAVMAQAEATLELANQQRIANLIALAGTEDPWAFESFRALADEDDNLSPEIARTLRIETP